MTQRSTHCPPDPNIADALRRLADLFDAGEGVMEGITITPTMSIYEPFYTRVQLDMRVYEIFEDPRARRVLPEKLSLPGSGYRIIEDERLQRFALPDAGIGDDDASSK